LVLLNREAGLEYWTPIPELTELGHDSMNVYHMEKEAFLCYLTWHTSSWGSVGA
jgi:hypothetical protein